MLIILAVIEIVFLMLTFASNIRAKIGPDPYALFLLISANLTFVVAWLGIKLALADRTLDRSLRALHSGLRDVSNTRSGVVTLFDHDFYDRFAKAMRDATNGVAITHLDTLPPNHGKKPRRLSIIPTFRK